LFLKVKKTEIRFLLVLYDTPIELIIATTGGQKQPLNVESKFSEEYN
jgi:hypothetical protein